MSNKIRVGIVGYGNLGKGVELALSQNPDFELQAIFTRRDPSSLPTKSKTEHMSEINNYKDKIDVMILCGGSANDLQKQAPTIAQDFNTVDTFDNHGKIPEYFETLNNVATSSKKLSLLSTGWDPGLFSLNRLLAQSVLPQGTDYTFWGRGVSQGHSDAVRKINGVKYAVQYTVPMESAIEKVRTGQNPELSTREKHQRVCYVVLENGVDEQLIEKEIKTMPNYFEPYDTIVNFISEDEFKKNHTKMPHGGFVIRTGNSALGSKQRIEFSLKLESNPEFTSSVLVAYTRAVYRLAKEGKFGALTVFDIPFTYLSPKSPEQLRRELL